MNTVKQKIKKTQFPLLRFLEFTDSWKSILIEEIINRVSKPVDVEATTLYQQIGIRSHGKGIFYKEPVTGKSLGNKRVFWIQPNMFIVNIVFAWEHAVAMTTEKELGMIASHRFPMYEPIKNKVDLDFLMYFFLRKRGKHLLGLASPGGAGRNKTLGQQTFAKLKVNIPTLPEQQKIANFLSSVDKKIEQLRQKVSLLEEYKKGVMQQIFSQQIRFKDDNGEAFADWEVKRLSQILKKSRLGGNYANSVTPTPYPLIKMGNLNRGKISLNKVYYIQESEKVEEIDKIQFEDLFFNTRNTLDLVGKVAMWRNELPVAYYNSNLMYLKFENNSFMNYRFNSYDGIKTLRRLATGTTSVAAIYTKDLMKIKFPIPSLKEQQKIANFLSSIDDKIQQSQQQLEQAQQFKKGLLQQLFV